MSLLRSSGPIRRCLSLGILACSWLFLSAANGPPALQTADAARYLDDIKSLTTPSMEGRGDGT